MEKNYIFIRVATAVGIIIFYNLQYTSIEKAKNKYLCVFKSIYNCYSSEKSSKNNKLKKKCRYSINVNN